MSPDPTPPSLSGAAPGGARSAPDPAGPAPGAPPSSYAETVLPSPSLPSLGASGSSPFESAPGAPSRPAASGAAGHDWISVAATIPPDAEGVKMLGGFEVRGLLGEGGMGKVYLAHDPTLHRLVALKTLRPELAAIGSLRERFIEEARSVARLNHPNIIQIYAAGVDRATPYFAMELIEGKSLREHLADEGPMALDRVLDYTIQSVHGLRAAWERQMIHRDIKPANLMLTRGGVVKIADFGLAKKLDGDLELTRTGTFVGSPYYMSPEQSEGKAVDFRTDVYSLGASMYHLLVGLPPFEGNTPTALMLKHLSEPIPAPDELVRLRGGAVHQLIARMMAKRLEQRFASYEDLLAALEALRAHPDGTEARRLIGAAPAGRAAGPAGPAVPASLRPRGKGSAARSPARGWGARVSSILMGLALVLLGVVAGMTILNKRAQRRAELADASTPRPVITARPPALTPAPTPSASGPGSEETGATGPYASFSGPEPGPGARPPRPGVAPAAQRPDFLVAKTNWSPLFEQLPDAARADAAWRRQFDPALSAYHYPEMAQAIRVAPGIDPGQADRMARFFSAVGRGSLELQQALAARVHAGEQVTFPVKEATVRVVAMEGSSYFVECADASGRPVTYEVSIAEASPPFLLAAMMAGAEPRTPRATAILLAFNYLYDVRRPTAEIAPLVEAARRDAIADVITYLVENEGGPRAGEGQAPALGGGGPTRPGGPGGRRPLLPQGPRRTPR